MHLCIGWQYYMLFTLAERTLKNSRRDFNSTKFKG